MEISGARVAVDNTIDLLKNNVDIRNRLMAMNADDYSDFLLSNDDLYPYSTERRSDDTIELDEKIIAATNRVDSAFNRLIDSYSREQIDHLDNIGYAFLDRDQLEIFYGPDGIYNYTSSFAIDLDDYANWTNDDRQAALHRTVRQLASSTDASIDEQFRSWQSRRLKQTALAPFAFGPTFGTPTVLGIVLDE